MRVAYAGLCLLCCALGCDSEPSRSGLDEPLRVSDAVFKSGELPGSELGDGEVPDLDGGIGPFVTGIQSLNAVVRPRQAGKLLTGRVSADTYSIAFRFVEFGTGYWVKPVGPEDVVIPGDLTWQATVDFGPDLPPGNHLLQFVAIDAHGHAGPHATFRLCVRAAYDDTLNACKASVPPPGALISLSWDTDADLDLVVVTPSGKTVDARHPSTLQEEGAEPEPQTPGIGLLSADSNPNCTLDTIRREDLVWQNAPESGSYLVYVRIWNACGKSASHFKLGTYARTRGQERGTYQLAELEPASYGEVLGSSASAGEELGLFVTTVDFP